MTQSKATGWEIHVTYGAGDDIRQLRVHDQRRIRDATEASLRFEPTAVARNRKPLPGISSPLSEHKEIWELRVGQYRVFYDVNPEEHVVTVLRIRLKPSHLTTEDIL
jgi:mRNA-degrading endonuclease RelE of RelBE toxin-antitoxin system